jgi:hypothetical protein
MTDGAQLILEQLTCLKKIINLKFEIIVYQVGVEYMLMLR